MAKIRTYLSHFLIVIAAWIGVNTSNPITPAESREQDWDDDDIHLFI